jgi:anthranilate phosphoribosyltransferase
MEKFLSGDFNHKLAAALLSIISFKGENIDEILGFAQALISGMKKFNSPYDDMIDIVGIGSNCQGTFNISTVASLIISCLDVKVAKEIRPSFSSKGCGNADFLEAMGINISASFEQKKMCLEQENFVFLNTPSYYPSLREIELISDELGFPTIISILRPLCHPAMVKRIVLGTPDRTKASALATALEALGIEKAYVLWNEEGYDELIPIGTTNLIVVEKDKEKRELSLTANDFSLAGNYKTGTPIPGGCITDNTSIMEDIYNVTSGIVLDTVIMNAVLGLRLAGSIGSLKEGTELVKKTLKKGLLKRKIDNIARISNSN